MHRRHRSVALVTLLILGVMVAACVPDANRPESCDAGAVSFATTLVEERLEPSTFDVCVGQEVSIEFDIQRNAILHLHGFDDQVPAREVRSGETVTFAFEATRSGQFPIAIHTVDGPAEATVGTLTVHEP